MAYMSLSIHALPLALALSGDEGISRAFNTIGINTTHTAVRGT
jgi:hypothetical protein